MQVTGEKYLLLVTQARTNLASEINDQSSGIKLFLNKLTIRIETICEEQKIAIPAITQDIKVVYDKLCKFDVKSGALKDSQIDEFNNIFKTDLSQLSQLINPLDDKIKSDSKVTLYVQQIQLKVSDNTEFTNDLKIFVEAQSNIILGFKEDIERPDNTVTGIHFGLWSSWGGRVDNADWAPVFIQRTDYIQQKKGHITFICPQAANYPQTSQKKYCPIDAKLVSIAYKLWAKSWESTQINNYETHIADSYDRFKQAFRAVVKNELKVGIDEGKKDTAMNIAKNGIKFESDEIVAQIPGETTYFELAYLLSTDIKFKFHTTGTQLEEFTNELQVYDENLCKIFNEKTKIE